jgi:hypothetical protein
MFEISENPEIIFQKEFDPNQFSVEKIRLDSHYSEIDLYNIVSIYIPQYDYEKDNFSRRLESLKKQNGWITMAGGTGFSIVSQKVSSIFLGIRYIKRYENSVEKDIINQIGNPDKILMKKYSESSGIERERILFYEQKMLCFFIDKNQKIKEIRIGTHIVDEANYQAEVS